MGTSKSSNGSPSRVPMVPPWVPPVAPPDTPPTPEIQRPLPIAPSGRFRPARINLGTFANCGSNDHMKRSLGQYVRKGYGGAVGMTRRMGGTIVAAERLYNALSHLAGTSTTDFADSLDRQLLQSRSAIEVLDSIINVVEPVDGTQDAEAARNSISRALSSLLNKDEQADIMNLTEDQKLFVIQEFISQDVASRFLLDCELTIKDKAPSLTGALSRIREIKDYIRETVTASFRQLKEVGKTLRSHKVTDIIQIALLDTFAVFEEYIS